MFSHRGFIRLRTPMNEEMKILIVEVSKRKCFSRTFMAKPRVTMVANNMLKIKRKMSMIIFRMNP